MPDSKVTQKPAAEFPRELTFGAGLSLGIIVGAAVALLSSLYSGFPN